jgi:hypothetical protein
MSKPTTISINGELADALDKAFAEERAKGHKEIGSRNQLAIMWLWEKLRSRKSETEAEPCQRLEEATAPT